MPHVIFALEIELIPPPGKGSMALIAWLNRNGQSKYCRAVSPKRRVIDLRAGDKVWHRGRTYRIKNVRAYRDSKNYPADKVADLRADGGYVVSDELKE